MRNDIIVGNKYETASCGDLIVEEFRSSISVDVIFIDTGFKVTTASSKIRSGQVKDLLKRNVSNTGFIGFGNYKSRVDGKLTEEYRKWFSMIGRCYNSKRKDYKYYGMKGVSVCSEWHNFQVFAKWYISNKPAGLKDPELDKDIIGCGKLYSPDNCIVVSGKENKQKAHSRSCTLKSPSGEMINIYNVSEFCRNMNLSSSAISCVINGKRAIHKGWTKWLF